MSPSHQLNFDGAYERWWNSLDKEIVGRAEREMSELKGAFGLDVYCPSHGGNHLLDARQVEKLIYGMAGDRADQRCEGEAHPGCEGKAGWQEAAEWCPLEDLGWMLDGETYAEHVDSYLESRQRSERLPS